MQKYQVMLIWAANMLGLLKLLKKLTEVKLAKNILCEKKVLIRLFIALNF